MEILFVLRKNQTHKEKPATVYARITLNGLRSGDFSTFIKVLPEHWNAKLQFITSGTDEALADNERLMLIRADIKDAYKDLLQEKKFPTAVSIKERYLEKTLAPLPLVELIQSFIKYKLELGRKEATEKTYSTKQNNITGYLKKTAQLTIAAQNIDESFLQGLGVYIKRDLACSEVHKVRHFRFIKEALSWAKSCKLINHNHLADLTWNTPDSKETDCLSGLQLLQLEKYEFVSEPLQETVDRFLMQCYTGFNYRDLMNFRPDWNIVDNWITLKRHKTDIEAIVPVINKLKILLEKYEYKPPKITNQCYNRYLKEIAAILNLRVHLTTRVARKTAGQLWLDAGFSIEAVSKMLGHSNIRTTQKSYVKVNKTRIELEMKRIGFLE